MALLPHPSRSLPIALMRAREAVMEPIRAMLAHEGLSEQQWRLLRVLDATNGPLDASGLARQAALLLPSQTRIVQALKERGYVTRTRGQDRRRLEVEITAHGRAVVARNAQRAAQLTENWRAHIGPERYEVLLEVLLDLSDYSASEGPQKPGG